ncbi:FecR domain-containing protein [bacterium]|nr:FecR domain-containing protein [bacterium]
MKKQSFTAHLLTILTAVSIVLMPAQSAFSQAAGDAPVTQGEFAKYLVRALGMEGNLPIGANTYEYINLLERQGITPPGGYEAEKPLNKKDMAYMMMKATGLENKVINRMRGKSVVRTEKAVVREIKGDVQFKRGPNSEFAAVELNDELYANDTIKTGADSSAVVQLGMYSGAFLGPNTEILIEELSVGKDSSENVRVFIKHGWFTSKVKKVDKPVNYETRTRTTVAGVMGTTYCQTSDGSADQLMACTGGIWFYLLDENGNPVGEPKVLKIKEKLITDPTGQQEPQFLLIAEDENGKIMDQGEFIQSLSSFANGDGIGQGTPSGQSTYQMRMSLSEADEDAYVAIIEVLNEAGIVIEETGAAATADSTITQAQLTQFINDLLLSDTFDFFNTDTTPF